MYALDTNIVIYLMLKINLNLSSKIKRINNKKIKIPSIVLAELEYSINTSPEPKARREQLKKIIKYYEVVPSSKVDAKHYGDIRANLRRKFTKI